MISVSTGFDCGSASAVAPAAMTVTMAFAGVPGFALRCEIFIVLLLKKMRRAGSCLDRRQLSGSEYAERELAGMPIGRTAMGLATWWLDQITGQKRVSSGFYRKIWAVKDLCPVIVRTRAR